jgi:hypothetical protein
MGKTACWIVIREQSSAALTGAFSDRIGYERTCGLPDNLEKCYQDLAYIAGHCAALKTLYAGTNAKGLGGNMTLTQ